MTAGMIVRSRAGRDKGFLLMVLAVDGPYVLLADGRTRTVEKPKRKKMRHVAPTDFKAPVSPDEKTAGGQLKTVDGRGLTNRELRRILSGCAAPEQEG